MGAAVLAIHSIGQLSEAFKCKKGFSKYFISLICTVFKLCGPAHLFPNTSCTLPVIVIKGIDRSFELRGEIMLIWSVMTNWRLGNFFLVHFKGTPSQDQQKTLRRRLITFKVTLTGQSHFMQYSTVQYTETNSVKSFYAVTPTPYNECTQFVDSVKSL